MRGGEISVVILGSAILKITDRLMILLAKCVYVYMMVMSVTPSSSIRNRHSTSLLPRKTTSTALPLFTLTPTTTISATISPHYPIYASQLTISHISNQPPPWAHSSIGQNTYAIRPTDDIHIVGPLAASQWSKRLEGQLQLLG